VAYQIAPTRMIDIAGHFLPFETFLTVVHREIKAYIIYGWYVYTWTRISWIARNMQLRNELPSLAL